MNNLNGSFENSNGNVVPPPPPVATPLHLVPDPALQGALDAIAIGMKVFPILYGTKDRCLTTWVYGGPGEEASSDVAQVMEWSRAFGRCNWGADTTGWSITDSDSPEGYKWAVDNALTDTRCVKSGSAKKEMAFHFYNRNPDGRKTKCSKIPGCQKGDIKADGGMVLLPGSLHPDGNLYTLVNDKPPSVTPEWFLEQFKKPEEEPAFDISDMKPMTAEQKRIALKSVDEECKVFEDTPEGQRHTALVKLSRKVGNVLAWNLIPREEIEERICTIGLDRARSQRAFKSTLKKNIDIGMRKPWNAERVDEFIKERGERKANSAGFGQAPLPVGASQVPLPSKPVSTVEVMDTQRGLPPLAKKGHLSPFPTHLLGPELQRATEAIAEHVESIPDIAAQSVLAGAALAVCGHYDVQLPYGAIKPTNLFLLTVGNSGDRKSAADNEAMLPVEQWERQLRLNYKRDIPHYEARMKRYEANKKEIYKDAGKSPALCAEELGPEPQPPTRPILRTDEPTMEGLRDGFIAGSRVMAVYSDEGGKFLGGHSMRSEQQQNAITTLSKMWDGTDLTKTRADNNNLGVINMGSTNGYRLAMHLMMQPKIAEGFLNNPIYQDQGILARFMVSWGDLEALNGHRFDKPINPYYDSIMEPYKSRVYGLISTPYKEDQFGRLSPISLPFSPAARKLWGQYKNEMQPWLRPDGQWRSINAFAAKALEHAARLGVVLQQFHDCRRELSAEYFEMAWKLVLHYGNQILATRNMIRDPELEKAHQLYRWLNEKHVGDVVDSRTIQRKAPDQFREKKVINDIVTVLIEYGALEPLQTGENKWRIVRGL